MDGTRDWNDGKRGVCVNNFQDKPKGENPEDHVCQEWLTGLALQHLELHERGWRQGFVWNSEGTLSRQRPPLTVRATLCLTCVRCHHVKENAWENGRQGQRRCFHGRQRNARTSCPEMVKRYLFSTSMQTDG